MRKRGLCLGVLLAAAGATSVAHATPQWRLVYVREGGAERCPEEMELRLAVAGRLGRDPFSSGASGAVVARIVQHGDELSGSVELIDDAGISRGKRELRAGAATCDDMARALALSISIAVDPERAQSANGDAEIPISRTEAAPSAPPAPAPALATPEPNRDREPQHATIRERSIALSVSALSLWGVAPALAWGGTFRVERRFGQFALDAGALAATAPTDQVRVGTLGSSLVAGELGACATGGAFEVCLVGLLGATWARAGDVALPHTDFGRFLAAGSRLGFALPATKSLGVFLNGSLLGVASPVRATIDDAQVWSAPPFVVALEAGAKFQFL